MKKTIEELKNMNKAEVREYCRRNVGLKQRS